MTNHSFELKLNAIAASLYELATREGAMAPEVYRQGTGEAIDDEAFVAMVNYAVDGQSTAWVEIDTATRRAWVEDGGEVAVADEPWTPERLTPSRAEVIDCQGRVYMRAAIRSAWMDTRELAEQAAGMEDDDERADAWEAIDRQVSQASRLCRDAVTRQLALCVRLLGGAA